MKNFLLRFFVLILPSIFFSSVLAQSPSIEWQKCYGGGWEEQALAMDATSDGGYILAGFTGSNEGDVLGNHGLHDFWVVKVSASGAMEWKKTLGGSSNDWATAIQQTPDGGYAVAGYSSSRDGDVVGRDQWSMNFWMVKLNSTGVIEWKKTLGGDKNDYCWSMDLTSDGGYILAGFSESVNGDATGNKGNRDVWVVKLNNLGNLQWQKNLGGSADDEAWSVTTVSDGGYVVSGYTESNDGDVAGQHGRRDAWVIKLTGTGNLQWQRCLGGSLFEEGSSVRATPDGGVVLAAYSSSNDGDVNGNHQALGSFSDAWIVKLAANGSIEWQKCYGGTFNERANVITPAPGGGYLVAGFAESNDGDVHCKVGLYEDFWAFKISSNGTLLWEKSMGGNNFDRAYGIQPAKDGGAVVAGFAGSNDVPGYHPNLGDMAGDFWAVKLSANLTEIPEPSVTISVPSTDICTGVPLTFTAQPINAGALPSFEWLVNGAAVGTNSSTFSSNNLSAGDVVQCRMTSTDCATATKTVASNRITMQGRSDVEPEVIVEASATTICTGSTVIFTAINKSGNLNPTYQWTVNGTLIIAGDNPQLVTNSLTDGSIVQCRMTVPQCGGGTTKDDSNPVVMTVKQSLNPSLTIRTTSQTVCKGNAVTFTAKTANAGAKPIYQWQINGVNMGSDEETLVVASLADGDVVTCVLKPDSENACAVAPDVASNSLRMTVREAVITFISIAASSNNVCEGTAMSFIATVENAGATPKYQWQVNGVDAGTDNPVFDTANLADGDKVVCILTAHNTGCALVSINTSNSIVAAIKQKPVVSISPSDTTVMAGTRLRLQGIVTGNASAFSWTPSNTLTDPQTLAPLTMALENNTTYRLSAVAANGCGDSKEVTIQVVKELFMPNSFTPNGDGLNDLFRMPPGSAFELREFAVFDRWGKKVFSTKNNSRGWDGTYKGKALDTNHYVYIIRGRDKGKETVVKGTVLLLR